MFKTIQTYIFVLFLTLQLTLPSRSSSYEEIENQEVKNKDFFVLTIPKSGSHLILKMLFMLTNKSFVLPCTIFPQLNALTFINENPDAFIPEDQMESAFTYWKINNVFPIAHFNFSENFYNFSLKHPEYVKIIQIRDLRDVCVSAVHHQALEIEKEIGPSTFDEKLMFMITLGNKPTQHSFIRIEENAKRALEWMKEPSTVVCRFEDLIGPKGGGNVEAQYKQILAISNSLNIDLSHAFIMWIIENLFGVNTGPKIPST